MAVIVLSGSLSVSPTSVADASSFPASTESVPLTLLPSQKPSSVDGGMQHRNVNSPSSYVALSGVGAADSVTQGNFLYLRTRVAMAFKLTTAVPGGGTEDAVLYVCGTMMLELDPSRYLTALAVKGSGQVEWMVSGTV